MKIEIGENTTKINIAENTLRTTVENYECMINSYKLLLAQEAAKTTKKAEEEPEDVQMKESYAEPPEEDKLDGLKQVIVDQ